ncbi:MAG: protein kinase [Planctomycetes bacterium]|nr:protein kinase [Planctomycetota bacterium]
MPEPAEDARLARAVLRAGLVDPALLDGCRRELEAQLAAGRPTRSLAGTLVDKNLLTLQQVNALLAQAPPPADAPAQPAARRPAADRPIDSGATPPTLTPDSPGFVPMPAFLADPPIGRAPAPHPAPSPQARRLAELSTLIGVPPAPLSPPPSPGTPGSTLEQALDGAPAAGGSESDSAATPQVSPRAPGPLPSPGAPAEFFGRYQLEREIARGGMGVVYRALDTQVKRVVALKVMLGDGQVDESARQRFRREGMLAARLHHPGIVPVYDIGEEGGRLYYTMEFVEGESLQSLVRANVTLPVRVALRIARDVALALDYAHQQGLVHRDIKPANLLLTLTGATDAGAAPKEADSQFKIGGRLSSSHRVLLADFGLAKDLGGVTRLTQSGYAMGTPLYMSPEQASGHASRVGPASDLYSLGAVVYEMLCGLPPFTETDPLRLMNLILLADPPPLRGRLPGLHADVETIVARAMHKDPARRYASARHFADDIDRWLAGEVIQARPATWREKAWRRVRRHKEVSTSVAAAAAVLLGVVGYFTLGRYVQERWRLARETAERRGREEEARRLLDAAEAALASERPREALAAATTVTERFAAAAASGEDVELPRAFVLMAGAYDRLGEPGKALSERLHAYRAALGHAGSSEVLLRLGAELTRGERYEDAVPLLLQVLRAPARPAPAGGPKARDTDAAVVAEARAWLGRARAGTLDFGGAVETLDEALADAALPKALRPEAEAVRDFARSFARTVDDLGPGYPMLGADLDGDGIPELASLDDQGLVLGHLEQGRFVQKDRKDKRIPYDRWRAHMQAIPCEAPNRRALALVGGLNDRAAAAVFLWDGQSMREVGRTFIPEEYTSYAWGDLDGDGHPDLLVGSAHALRAYRWIEPLGRLAPMGAPPEEIEAIALPVEGDVCHIEIGDFAGRGKPEALLFLGRWGGYAVTRFEWSPDIDLPVPAGSAFLSPVDSVVRVDRPGRPPALLAAAGWSLGDLFVQRRVLGEDMFAKLLKPGGFYLVELTSDPWPSITRVYGDETKEPLPSEVRVVRLHARAGDYLCCEAGEKNERRVSVFRSGVHERPLIRLAFSKATEAMRGRLVEALDVDGDGYDEAVFRRPDGMRLVLGAARPSAGSAIAQGRDEAATQNAAPRTPRDPRLDYASALERASLDYPDIAKEAAVAYQEVLLDARTLADTREAVEGELRCLAERGEHAKLAEVATTEANRFPELEVELLRCAARLLDEARAWEPASRVADRLLRALELSATARQLAIRDADRFRGLAAPAHRLRLSGPNPTRLDWMATSPLAVTPQEDGSWILHASGDAEDRLVARVGGAWDSWKMTGRVTASRLDWGVTAFLGVGLRDPLEYESVPASLEAVRLRAAGGSRLPIYQLSVVSKHGEPASAHLYDAGLPWPATPLAFSLSTILHQGRTCLTVEGLPGSPTEGKAADVPGRTRTEPVWVGVLLSSRSTARERGRFRIENLELWHTTDRLGFEPFHPKSAVEHLATANALWIQGKLKEARHMYDLAMRLADTEANAPQAETEQPPDALMARKPTAGDIDQWVAVDARFYKGLMLGADGAAAGANRHLEAAWERSPERFRTLLARYSLALLEDRPAERDVLRAWWRSREGAATPERRPALGNHTVHLLGPEAAEVVLEGAKVRTESLLLIDRVRPGDAGDLAGLQPGDQVAAVDGKVLGDAAEYGLYVMGAGCAGRDRLTLSLRRGPKAWDVSVPVKAPGFMVRAEKSTFVEWVEEKAGTKDK